MAERHPHIAERMPLFRVPTCLAAALLPLAGAAFAGAETLCHAAARVAADRSGVPFEVLIAISRTETGRATGGTVEPWPWTINDSGDGYWFATRAEAEAHAAATLAAGRTSFDLGCFQLNYRWHHGGFASAAAMLDPEDNALYAAQFLADLYTESGDWSVAAGAYHSRTAEYATRYRARFDEFHAAARAQGRQPGLVDDRPNSFPLLQQGEGRRAPGSLVPLDFRG